MLLERNTYRRLYWLIVLLLSAGLATHAGLKADTFQRQNLSIKTELIVSGNKRAVPTVTFHQPERTVKLVVPRHFDMALYHHARALTAFHASPARFLSRNIFVPYTPVKMISSRPDDPSSHSTAG